MTKSQRITIDDLWKLTRPSGLALSPDGTQAVVSRTAYDMAENKASTSLYLLSTFGGAPRRLTSCGDKDGQAAWSPDGALIAFVAKRAGDKEPQLYTIAPDGGEAVRVTNLATGVSGIKWFPNAGGKQRIAFISWVWPDLASEKDQAQRLKERQDSKVSAHVVEHTVFRYWDHWLSDGRVPMLHVVDLATGKCKNLFAQLGSSRQPRYSLPVFDTDQHDFDISPDGRRIAFNWNADKDPRGDQPLSIVEIDVARRRAAVLLAGGKYSFHHPRYSPDGKTLALLSNNIARSQDDDNTLAIYDFATRTVKHNTAFDRLVNHPLKWSADGSSIYFTADEHSRLSLWQWPLREKLPHIVAQGGTVSDFDVAADACVFIRNNMSQPPKVFAKAGADDRALERWNDELMARFKLGQVREFTVKGWNGEPVQMWAVYPPNFDPKKKWPLLHSIHGGPHSNWGDNFHFRWNNHVFAAQGYVVVCVNYHGSLGWGNEYLESNNGSYGTKEHADVEAATDFMLKQGYIDKNRLAASGGSYGGKMVAWMNGRNGKRGKNKGGDRYKAYICHAGCFDWRAMYGGDAGYWFNHSLRATYWGNPEKFAAQNPITEVQHARTPTLVLHGALDYRVPDQQGLAYYSTLKSLGTEARLVFFPDENHWILKPQNSRLWYQEYFAWLKRWVG